MSESADPIFSDTSAIDRLSKALDKGRKLWKIEWKRITRGPEGDIVRIDEELEYTDDEDDALHIFAQQERRMHANPKFYADVELSTSEVSWRNVKYSQGTGLDPDVRLLLPWMQAVDPNGGWTEEKLSSFMKEAPAIARTQRFVAKQVEEAACSGCGLAIDDLGSPFGPQCTMCGKRQALRHEMCGLAREGHKHKPHEWRSPEGYSVYCRGVAYDRT